MFVIPMFVLDLPPFIPVVAGLMLVIAVWRDLLHSRIDNWLTMSGACLALLLHINASGLQGAQDSLLGLCIGLALLLPFYIKGGMAAGDVKLMAAIGACVGVQPIFWIAMYSLLAGSVLALSLLLVKRELGPGLLHMGQQISAFACTRVWVPATSITSKKNSILTQRFPYAAAIATGSFVFVFTGPPPGL